MPDILSSSLYFLAWNDFFLENSSSPPSTTQEFKISRFYLITLRHISIARGHCNKYNEIEEMNRLDNESENVSSNNI
jgi:hypothetical protein